MESILNGSQYESGTKWREYDRITPLKMATTERSLKSLEVISATLSSGQSPSEMAEFALGAVRTETGVEAAELFLLDTPRREMVLAAHSGLFPEAFSQITHFPVGQGFPGLIAASGEPLFTDSLSEDRRYLRNGVKEKGFRHYLCLPLTRGRDVLGCLNMASRGRPISAESWQFATIVSSNLSVALDRANLQLWKDLSVSAIVPSGGTVLEELGRLVLQNIVNMARALGGAVSLSDQSGTANMTLATRVCEESGLTAPGVSLVSARTCYPQCMWQRFVLPLNSNRCRCGSVCLAYPRGEPVPRILPWLQLAVEESANAINWAFSLQRSQDMAISTEKQHLSREVHDSLSQNLALIAQQAELASRLSERDTKAMRQELHNLRATIRQSREDMHRVLQSQSPSEIATGFAGAVSHLVKRLQDTCPVKIHLNISGDREPPSNWHLPLYRLIQEALTNVIAHADATQTSVEIEMRPPVLTASIRDNGRGFDLGILQDPSRRGLGLRYIQERVEALGGVFSVESSPGSGTCLRLAVPYIERSQLRIK